MGKLLQCACRGWKQKKKNDCSTQAACINSIVGNSFSAVLQVPTAGGKYDPANTKALTDYSKGALAKLGLPNDIDPVHSLNQTGDPVTMAFTSDIIDHQSGQISFNLDKESRLTQTLSQMVESGIIKQEQVAGIQKEVEDHWQNGTVPDGLAKLVSDESQEAAPTNESVLLKIKGFTYFNK